MNIFGTYFTDEEAAIGLRRREQQYVRATGDFGLFGEPANMAWYKEKGFWCMIKLCYRLIVSAFVVSLVAVLPPDRQALSRKPSAERLSISIGRMGNQIVVSRMLRPD